MASADAVVPPPAVQRAARSPRASRGVGGLRWLGLFALLLLTGLASLAMFLFSPEWTRLEGSLAVGMASPLLADYSADPVQRSTFAPLSTAILAEALIDREREERPAAVHLATLMDDLRTPVPTVTPRPTLAPTLSEGTVITAGPGRPTATWPARTAEVLRTLQASPSPLASRTATATSVAPTPVAPTPVAPTPVATATPVAPTPVATATRPWPTRAPTETARPPIFRPSPTSDTIKPPLPSRTPDLPPQKTPERTLPPKPTSTQAPPTKPPPPPPTETRPPAPTAKPPEPTQEDPYPPPPPPSSEETPSYPYP